MHKRTARSLFRFNYKDYSGYAQMESYDLSSGELT